MPYESTIVLNVPADGTYFDIKQHIKETTIQHGIEPEKWSITVTSEPHCSWGYVSYVHPFYGAIDMVNASWSLRFPNCSIERIHRVTQKKFFEDIANNTRSGLIGIGIVHNLVELSNKGVSTAGMLAWIKDVRFDCKLIKECLEGVRGLPYEPGKDHNNYP
jgi:hypothetical protein